MCISITDLLRKSEGKAIAVKILNMNPSYDHWVILAQEPPIPKVLRGDRVVTLVDGKGLDIGRVFNTLKFADYECLNITGGVVGSIIESGCLKEGIRSRFFRIEGESRINTIVVYEARGDALVVNEPGPAMSGEEVRGFIDFFKSAVDPSDELVISGTGPVGFSPENLIEIVDHASRLGIAVKADIGGAWLERIVERKLDTLKINSEELMTAFGISSSDYSSLCDFKAEFGIGCLVITRGKEGSVALAPDGSAYEASADDPVSDIAVGCGDSFFAGLLCGARRGLPFEKSLGLACACGYANTLRYGAGIFTSEDLEIGLKKTRIQRLV